MKRNVSAWFLVLLRHAASLDGSGGVEIVSSFREETEAMEKKVGGREDARSATIVTGTARPIFLECIVSVKLLVFNLYIRLVESIIVEASNE